MEGWPFRFFGDRHEGVEERASRGRALGKYVEENVLEVNLERERRRPDIAWPYAQMVRRVLARLGYTVLSAASADLAERIATATRVGSPCF